MKKGPCQIRQTGRVFFEAGGGDNCIEKHEEGGGKLRGTRKRKPSGGGEKLGREGCSSKSSVGQP